MNLRFWVLIPYSMPYCDILATPSEQINPWNFFGRRIQKVTLFQVNKTARELKGPISHMYIIHIKMVESV